MKTLGIIGGISTESTAHYYERINACVRKRVGGLHSAPLLIWSFDFGEMSDLQLAGDEVTITEKLVDAAQRLERAGAEGLLIACNTKHYAATDVTAAISIPFLHIADGVGRAINAAGHRRVGLLGTRFVMEQAFYRDYLEAEFDLDIIVPGDADRISLHDLILDELVRGIVSENGQALLREVASRLGEEGATCAILGCTELEMAAVAGQEPIPYFDTTALHVDAAIDFIVG